MKILQVVTMFTPAVVYGGPSKIAAQQARTLAGCGNQVTVVTSNTLELKPVRFVQDHETYVSGVRVKYFPSRILYSHFPFIVSRELSSWLRRHVEDFDVVHIHFAREWIPVRAAQIAIGKGVPTFLQTHGMLDRVDGVRSLIDWLWTKRLLNNAAGVLCSYELEGNEIRRRAPRTRVLELPNGIDVPEVAKVWTPGSSVEPVVLFLARLHPRKRVLAFLEMARILQDRGLPARYRIVGPNGGDLAAAQRFVRKHDLEDRVVFLGSLQGGAVFREYLSATVYVLPSVNEPFPMTVLEALSVGVPTVVTDTCYIAPMLESNDAALVSAPEPEALAESVASIVREPELAERLSSAGRQLVREELTMDRLVERLESYYGYAHA